LSVTVKEEQDGKRKDEFFNYLAYNGIKNQKLAELEKKKAAVELSTCTFTPSTAFKN
jgi:hypothetical protein